MRTVVQRAARAEVRVGGEVVARIGPGLALMVGMERGDGEDDVRATVRKLLALRTFPGRTPTDRTIVDVGGAFLVVSQFTLAASLSGGNRPSFDAALEPAAAERLYQLMVADLRASGRPVETGRFGAHMEVEVVSDGPVTYLLRVRAGRLVEDPPPTA